jgi:hypothetical protein
MNHQHTSKVLTWGLNEKYDSVPLLYGCTDCEETSATPFTYEEIDTGHSEHIDYVQGCFGCKAETLQLSTGDAGRVDSMSDKKWNAELSAYRDARSQGIQPAGTTMKAVKEAVDASDKLGAAYNADVMPSVDKITKQSAAVLKHTGDI